MSDVWRLAFGQLTLLAVVAMHLLWQRRVILLHWGRTQHGHLFLGSDVPSGDEQVDEAERQQKEEMVSEVEYFCDLTATRILLAITFVLSLVRNDVPGLVLGVVTALCLMAHFYYFETLSPAEYFAGDEEGWRRSLRPARLSHGMVVLLNVAPLAVELSRGVWH